jgi:hypothetical protein
MLTFNIWISIDEIFVNRAMNLNSNFSRFIPG